MDDQEIIQLYWNRDERAIEETDAALGPYCRTISVTILGSREDAEECVNDAYLHLWNVIPPQRPKSLSSFLGRIVRNLSVDKLRRSHAAKRGGGEYPLVLDELSECVPDSGSIEEETENEALKTAMNRFVSALPERDRVLFLLRYFYMKSIRDCAAQCGVSEGSAKVTLHRVRRKLKTYLQKEDISI